MNATLTNGRFRFRHDQPKADAHTAGQARVELGRWLRPILSPSDIETDDVLLAVNEALANAAEHAYAGVPGGFVGLDAVYDAVDDSLCVTIVDRGRWQEFDQTAPLDPHSVRGRGLRMMRMLSDETSVDFSSTGTRVEMSWQSAGS